MAKNQQKTEEEEVFAATATAAGSFIMSNIKIIGIALGVIIVACVGFFIWRNHQADVEAEAQKAIAKSQQAFMQDQYEQALKGDGAGQKGFLKIIDEYSGTKTANLAKYYAGICYYNMDKTDDAIKMLEDFDQKNDMLISPASYAALGDCYAAKGDTDKAIELMLTAAKDADSKAEGGVNYSEAPQFVLKAAKLAESKGNKEKALELYESIKTKYVRSDLSMEVDKYIERLK